VLGYYWLGGEGNAVALRRFLFTSWVFPAVQTTRSRKSQFQKQRKKKTRGEERGQEKEWKDKSSFSNSKNNSNRDASKRSGEGGRILASMSTSWGVRLEASAGVCEPGWCCCCSMNSTSSKCWPFLCCFCRCGGWTIGATCEGVLLHRLHHLSIRMSARRANCAVNWAVAGYASIRARCSSAVAIRRCWTLQRRWPHQRLPWGCVASEPMIRRTSAPPNGWQVESLPAHRPVSHRSAPAQSTPVSTRQR